MFFLACAMIISLFISRAALSICVAAFIIAAISMFNIKFTALKFIRTPLLFSVTLLFLIPFVSGIWSDDKTAWLDVLRTKLPLLLLPLAFASNFTFTRQQWRALAVLLLIIVFAGSLCTMGTYLQEAKHFEESYLRSSTLPTPLENDHVRFSWLVAFCVLVSAWLFVICSKLFLRILILTAGLWLIVFLHILAARTGLLVVYFLGIFIIVRLLLRGVKPAIAMISIACLVALPFIAYKVFPTFKNRVKFVSYDYGYFKDAHYLPGGSDAMRVISFKAGLNSAIEQPIIGYGFGDIKETINDYYATHYQQVKPEDRIMPSSEILLYGVGSGVIGVIALLWVMLVPFFMRVKDKFAWCMLNIAVAIPLVYDVGLEIQYGVFIYVAILLFLWKWFTAVDQKN